MKKIVKEYFGEYSKLVHTCSCTPRFELNNQWSKLNQAHGKISTRGSWITTPVGPTATSAHWLRAAPPRAHGGAQGNSLDLPP